MEENKIFTTGYNKESYLSVIQNDNDDYIFEEYDLNNEKEKKQEFEPQQISKEKPIESNIQQVNNQQQNTQQTNVLLCQICKGTFWSVSAYNLHWSCKNNLKCGYCCLYGHTISKCPSLNKPIKDIIE